MLLVIFSGQWLSTAAQSSPDTPWLVHLPPGFTGRNYSESQLLDVRHRSSDMHDFKHYVQHYLKGNHLLDSSDGELVDVVEHFFWGQKGGLALELGALDGSEAASSQTAPLVQRLNWTRVLIEGNPTFRQQLPVASPDAASVSAAICDGVRKVHFLQPENGRGCVAGIWEFMEPKFVRHFHPWFADQYSKHFNSVQHVIDSIRDGKLMPPYPVVEIDCVPLSLVLHELQIKHLNFFILDVEGGELAVLRTIDWQQVHIDVLCVETDPQFRPPNYAQDVRAFLAEHGFRDVSGQIGRNLWFVHESYAPASGPFSAYRGFCHVYYNLVHSWPPDVPCQ